jgi:NifU-like N terminal domain
VSALLVPELPLTVRRLFGQLHHAGPLEGPDGSILQGEAGSVKQGVQVRFFWQVEGSVIRAARYQAYGCPYTLAACEWLAQALPGRSRDAPWPGDPRQWLQVLEAPPERLGRFLVIEDALRAAQAAWR